MIKKKFGHRTSIRRIQLTCIRRIDIRQIRRILRQGCAVLPSCDRNTETQKHTETNKTN